MQSSPQPSQFSFQRLAPFLVIADGLMYAGIVLRFKPEMPEPDEFALGEHKVKLLPGDPEHQLQIRGAHFHSNAEFKAIQVGMPFSKVRSILHVSALTNEERARDITSADESRVSFIGNDNSAIEVLLRKGIVAEKHHLSAEMFKFTEAQRHVNEYP